MAANRETVIRYYLKRLAEYRKQGYDDYKAADLAEKDTKAKHGYIPK